MGLKRRDFIKAAGWTLAALGLTEAQWLYLGNRYSQALALPSPRKLALLIGINQYPHTQVLSGCITDVELQRELLIHRFGFQDSDILTLTDEQASREHIETAFITHLTDQAQPGDIVVFHFSGYGRRVPIEGKKLDLEASSHVLVNSLVPIDGVITTSDPPIVNDLLEDTLWLLLQSLSTDKVTTILDTSFKAPSIIRGYLKSRSYPQVVQGQLNPEELEFGQQIQQKSKQKIQAAKLKTSVPGVVITANATDLATEKQWTGFSAGLLTYALTQFLWEATPPVTIQVSLNRVVATLDSLVGKPIFLSRQKNHKQPELAYNLMPEASGGADGVVTLIEDEGKTAQVWLAGLPPQVLEYYWANSRLNVVSSDSSPLQLQLRSRNGLLAKAQVSNTSSTTSLQVGQLLQEVLRVLPRNIKLNIALDGGLERIERVDATSAVAAIPHISLVTASEQPADYVFGRVQETQTLDESTNPSRYGLYSLSQELIPNTAGEAGEAIKIAVHRLIPKLQTLLAAKLWRLTDNEASSRLAVKATLEIISPTQQVLMERETKRSLQFSDKHNNAMSPVAIREVGLPIGSRIQYRIHNQSDRSLYLLLLGLDSTKSAIALYPLASASENNSIEAKPLFKDIVIAPGETLTVPQTTIDFEWVIHAPAAVAETQLLFSVASFTQTLAALQTAMHPQSKQQISTLLNPLEVTQALLQDLHNASAIPPETNSSTTDTYSLDINAWASLSFVYPVVET